MHGPVVVPPAVRHGLEDPRTPLVIREWISRPPDWIEFRAPQGSPEPGGGRTRGHPAAHELRSQGVLLLCDDKPAVNRARRGGLDATGTLGVLQLAHRNGSLDIEEEDPEVARADDDVPSRDPPREHRRRGEGAPRGGGSLAMSFGGHPPERGHSCPQLGRQTEPSIRIWLDLRSSCGQECPRSGLGGDPWDGA